MVSGHPDVVYDLFVTFEASLIRNSVVTAGNSDVFGKVLRRESQRVVESVERFRHILAENTGGRMTVVANRSLSVAALHPAFVLFSHYMAVSACSRIVRHVRSALGIAERVHANPDENPDKHCKQRNEHNSPPATQCLDHSIISAR